MGCWHDRHGCGSWYPGPYGRAWYGPPDWYEGYARPMPRRYRGQARIDRAQATEELEARLEELRTEMQRMEAELMELRGSGGASASTTEWWPSGS
jgi:hypothetical protein